MSAMSDLTPPENLWMARAVHQGLNHFLVIHAKDEVHVRKIAVRWSETRFGDAPVSWWQADVAVTELTPGNRLPRGGAHAD